MDKILPILLGALIIFTVYYVVKHPIKFDYGDTEKDIPDNNDEDHDDD